MVEQEKLASSLKPPLYPSSPRYPIPPRNRGLFFTPLFYIDMPIMKPIVPLYCRCVSVCLWVNNIRHTYTTVNTMVFEMLFTMGGLAPPDKYFGLRGSDIFY